MNADERRYLYYGRMLIRTLIAALSLSMAASGAPLRILIAYHSETGNTEKLAEAIRTGAASVEGVEVIFRKTAAVTDADIISADAVLLGTPVYWGSITSEAKRFLERLGNTLIKARREMGEGRAAGVFCTGGSESSGKEMARLSAIAAFLGTRFVVVGGVDSEGFGTLGPQATTLNKPPADTALTEARAYGERFARIATRLRQPTPEKATPPAKP